MSAKAKAYIGLVVALGAAAAVRGVLTWTPHDLLRFACYLVLAVPASALKVRLPGVMGTMSVMFVFLLAAIVDIGLAETLAMSAICVLVQAYWRPRVKPRPVQIIFSISVLFIACTGGDYVYYFTRIPWLVPATAVRLLLLASVFFLLNTFPMAAVIALTENRRLTQIWTELYIWSFPYYLVGAGLVGFFGSASSAITWQTWVLILPAVYAIYNSYKLYLNQFEMQKTRAENERLHAEQVAELLRHTIAANEALRRANADLEQFAYAASHDLQEPLRNIKIYSELLQRRHGHKLEADGEKLVRTITDGARRINELIGDLLSYARTENTEPKPPELVNPQEVLNEVEQTLRDQIRTLNAVITCEHIPAVCVHRTHLVQLFQNVLSNSLKYHCPERPLSVHISAVAIGTVLDISIRDNGIGIHPDYHERIFGVFKRLHSRNVPGTGIGLAICKKIVESYRGRISVDSTGEHGSTFHFTLPLAMEAGATHSKEVSPESVRTQLPTEGASAARYSERLPRRPRCVDTACLPNSGT